MKTTNGIFLFCRGLVPLIARAMAQEFAAHGIEKDPVKLENALMKLIDDYWEIHKRKEGL